MRFIRFFFTIPMFTDEDLALQARMLHRILLAFIGVTLLTFITPLFVEAAFMPPALLMGILITSLIIQSGLLVLLQRGQVRLASWLLVVIFWVVITIVAVITGGVRAPAYLSYPVIVALAGLLLGGRVSLGVVVVSAVAGLGMMYAVEQHFLAQSALPPTNSALWFSHTTYLGLLLAVSWLSTSAMRQALRRARASEAQYQMLFEKSPNGLCITDPQGHILLVNPVLCQLLGYTPAEVVGRPAADLIAPASGQTPPRPFTELRTPEPLIRERVVQHQQGGLIDIRLTSQYLPDGRFLLIVQDITERKRADAALRESEARFRAIAEATPTPLVILAQAGGHWRYSNPASTSLLGQTLDTIVPQLAQVDLAPQLTAPHRMELELHRPDGRRLWVMFSSVPITFENEACQLIGLVDITDRKLAEDVTQRSLTQLFTLNQIGRAVTTLTDLPTTLRQILAALRPALALDAFFVGLYDPAKNWLEYPLAYDDGQFWPEEPRLLQADSYIGQVLTSRQPVLINRTPADMVDLKGGSRAIGQRAKVSACFIIVPLVLNQAAIGTLSVHSYTPHQYREEHVALLTSVAHSVVTAIHNARLFTDLQHQLTEHARISAALSASEDRYRMFIARSSEGVWRFDHVPPIAIQAPLETQVEQMLTNSHLAECNDAFAHMYGYPNAASMLGLPLDAILLRTDPANLAYQRHYIQNGYRNVDAESHEVGVDGQARYFLNNSVGIVVDGYLVSTWGTQRDITARKQAEAALRDSETRFRAIAEATPNPLVITTLDAGLIKYSNPALSTLVGVPLVELLGQPASHFYAYPEERSARLALLQNQTTAGPWEMQIKRSDGQALWVLVSNVLIAFDGQDCVLTGLVDITARKQAEEQLRVSEEQFHSLYDNATIGIYRSTPAGRLLASNPAGVRLLGYETFEEIAQRNLEQEGYEAGYTRQAFREQLEREGVIMGQESAWKKKDGSVIYVRESAKCIRDEAGQVLYYDGTFEDITAQKAAEAAQRQYAARLEILHEIDRNIVSAQSLEDIANAALIRIRRLVICVRASVSLFNFDTHETVAIAVSQDSVTHFGPGSRGTFADYGLHIIDQLQRGELYREADETEVAGASSENRQFAQEGIRAWLIAPLLHQGELIGALHLGRSEAQPFNEEETTVVGDVASPLAIAIQQARLRAHLEQFNAELEERVRQRTEELHASNTALAKAARLKDEFLANMSHELRTPLTSILTFAQLLQKTQYGALNEKQSRAAHTIEASGRHLLELINDILDLSKIESGKMEVLPELVLADDISRASLQLVRQLATAKHQQVSYHCQPLDLRLWADARQLKQMLVNLLSNAVKFTPEGGALGLEVVGRPAADPQGPPRVRFTVWDRGIGIAEADLSRLFQPFIQLDSRLAREYPGTGLGLALVRRMAELHGGQVSVESQLGHGSRFAITLPWHPTPPTPLAEPEMESPVVSAPPSVSQPVLARLLLVEDNEINRQMLVDYLTLSDFTVTPAASGAQALAMVHAEIPDLILMDIQMPEMDGLETIQRLRRLPGVAQLPIIAITALAMPGDRDKCLAAGATDYLSKPVRLEELLTLIQHHLLARPPLQAP